MQFFRYSFLLNIFRTNWHPPHFLLLTCISSWAKLCFSHGWLWFMIMVIILIIIVMAQRFASLATQQKQSITNKQTEIETNMLNRKNSWESRQKLHLPNFINPYLELSSIFLYMTNKNYNLKRLTHIGHVLLVQQCNMKLLRWLSLKRKNTRKTKKNEFRLNRIWWFSNIKKIE